MFVQYFIELLMRFICFQLLNCKIQLVSIRFLNIVENDVIQIHKRIPNFRSCSSLFFEILNRLDVFIWIKDILYREQN